VASNLRLKIEESQALLEINDSQVRLKKVNELLSREVDLSAMQAKIQSEVKDEISKSQRDYFLREQVRAIHTKNWGSTTSARKSTSTASACKKARMPKEAPTRRSSQLKRLEQMHPEAAESTVIRSYLDWLVEMPWSRSTKDVIDIRRGQRASRPQSLRPGAVKDRILEYLSVRKLNPK
jgi:ATP-dependent Lon protease